MFAKFEAEKISSTEFQEILKKKKQNPKAYKADCWKRKFGLLPRQWKSEEQAVYNAKTNTDMGNLEKTKRI